MDKYTVNVPKGVRYLGNWPEFNFSNFQNQHVIINKQITGCGFTEYALRCDFPIVLCSPRKMLMENKKKQHGDRIFLVKNIELDFISSNVEYDPQEKSTNRPLNLGVEIQKSLEEYKLQENSIYIRIKNELYNYLQTLPLGLSPKIIVTYDSTYIIKKILEEWNLLDKYYFVVDEFQAILDDSRFKAGTELEFMNILQRIPSVLFVSATPMLDKYLEMLDEFKNLDYYQLDWEFLDPTRVQRPELKIRSIKSIIGAMRAVIQSYLDSKFEKVVVERQGQLVEVESKECVIYVNSVNHIIRIIRDMRLTPDQVNILCSDTPENRKRLDKKLGKDYKIGSIPLKGEPHKMFTLCTRTVYLGADFYSECARSFIFSDSNSDCLSIDISMDLPQILGRQRLEENPWHNSAEFYYRVTCDYKKMTKESFDRIISNKVEETKNLLNLWSKGTEAEQQSFSSRYQGFALIYKYKKDYISVNKESTGKLQPCFNNLVYVNDIRTFDIQQIDYADRFTVISNIDSKFGGLGLEENKYLKFFEKYKTLDTYVKRIKAICDFLIEFPEAEEVILGNLSETDIIRQQLIAIGPHKIKGWGYNFTKINTAMGITIFDQSILEREIYSKFNIGDRLTKAEIKNTLRVIYDEVGYKKTPKANDLENWFKVKLIQITNNETSKRDAGFEIIEKK